MGNSAFKKTEAVEKAKTIQGGDTGTSPNQAAGKLFSNSGAVSSPAPRPKGLRQSGGQTTQGADTGPSPNTTMSGYAAGQLKQPGAYTGGGGKGEVSMPKPSGGGYGTTDGATVPPSPNQADGKKYDDASNPNDGAGQLANGADKPGFDTGNLARRGMGSGAEMPVMARGTPPMARIASGDLRRGLSPVGSDTARPNGEKGPKTLAGFARSGGYVPLDPQSVSGKPQAPTKQG